MDYFPEFIAQAAFLPCGVAMQLLFLQTRTNAYIFSYLSGMIAALLTGILLTTVKLYKKREHFLHFYILLFGIVCMLINGILLLIANTNFNINYVEAANILQAIGHGIIYIAGLSYVNLRAFRKRAFRISICHCWYLIGYAIGSILLYESHQVYVALGLTFVISSGIIIGCIIVNEVLHGLKSNRYNYKKSLDKQVTDANEHEKLLVNRMELINSYKLNPVCKINEFPAKNPWIISILILLVKLKGFMVVSLEFMIFTQAAGVKYETSIAYVGEIALIIGIIIGICGLVILSTKTIYNSASFLQAIILIISIILYYNLDPPINSLVFNGLDPICLWLFYGFFGINFSIGDIFILELTNLKVTELFLAIGYIIEILPIFLINYLVYDMEFLVIMLQNVDIFTQRFIGYVGVFTVTILILLIFVAILVPNTLNKTLLQIRDKLWGINCVFDSTIYGNYNHSDRPGGNDKNFITSPTTPATSIYYYQNNNNNNKNSNSNENPYLKDYDYYGDEKISGNKNNNIGGDYKYLPNTEFDIFKPTYTIPRVALK